MKRYFMIILCFVSCVEAMEDRRAKVLYDQSKWFIIGLNNKTDLVYKKPELQTNISDLWELEPCKDTQNLDVKSKKNQEIDIVYNGFKKFLGDIYDYKPEKQLVGGLINTPPYSCVVNNDKYVVRTFSGSSAARYAKMTIHFFAAGKGIAPKTHYCHHDDDSSFLIMDFIATPTLSVEQAHKIEVIDLVAQKVKSIAQFDINMETANKENVFDEIMRIHSIVENKKISESYVIFKVLKEMKYTAEMINQKIKDDNRPLVINHNDFHPRNIFFINNDIRVIDWDTLALNYQFYDLAGYSLFSCLNDEQDSYLLTQYLERKPTSLDTDYFKKIKLMGRVCLVLSGLQFVESIPLLPMESIKDFKYYATAFAQSADADSPEFFYYFGMSQLRELRKEYKDLLK